MKRQSHNKESYLLIEKQKIKFDERYLELEEKIFEVSFKKNIALHNL